MEIFGVEVDLKDAPADATDLVVFEAGHHLFHKVTPETAEYWGFSRRAGGFTWRKVPYHRELWEKKYGHRRFSLVELNIWREAPADATHYTKQAGGRFLKVEGDDVFFSTRAEGLPAWYLYRSQIVSRMRLENAVPRPDGLKIDAPEKVEKVMFKVGDEVRVICDHPAAGWGPYVEKGDVGRVVVDKPDRQGRIRVTFPNHRNWIGRPEEFELVVPAKKVYTLADLKGTGLDAQLKASAVDARTLRKLRDRVVCNLNDMPAYNKYKEEERTEKIIRAFDWELSPERTALWSKVHAAAASGFVPRVEFKDIPAKPRVKKAAAVVAPQANPAPVAAPLPPKKPEKVVKAEPAKKVGWW